MGNLVGSVLAAGRCAFVGLGESNGKGFISPGVALAILLCELCRVTSM